jgi:hypothetical protein
MSMAGENKNSGKNSWNSFPLFRRRASYMVEDASSQSWPVQNDKTGIILEQPLDRKIPKLQHVMQRGLPNGV